VTPARGEAIEGRLAQILRRRLHELRLLRSFFRRAGNGEIGERKIGLETARCGVEGRAGYAERLCRRPLRGEPLLECGIGGARGRRKCKQCNDRQS
jgi:hypothetical protein